MSIHIRLLALADGRPSPDAGRYLVTCDVDANDGRGLIETTDDITQAKAFDSTMEAWDYWARPSTVRPRRSDGRPNRPLTAYTIEIARESADAPTTPQPAG